MKKERSIEKKKFRNLIEAFSGKYQVFAPIEEDGNIVFKDVSHLGKITFDYLNSKTNPKSLFLPQFETLFYFKKAELIPATFSGKQFVIFGIRPCDVQGLAVLDKIFLTGDYQDIYYRARREKGIIVSLSCNNPDLTCFCAGVGGGPAREEGSDVMAYELGEKIILKPITKKGEDLISTADSLLKEASQSDLVQKEKQITEAEEKINTRIDLEAVKKSLDQNFDSDFWEEIHPKCIGCGICTYLCPTCYCFDLTDEMLGAEGKRLRSWDSCMFPLFTLQASGHNPRPSGKERFRQRIIHKFKYLPDNYQITGCTGCGRCVRECPVNLDIREVLNSVITIGSLPNYVGK